MRPVTDQTNAAAPAIHRDNLIGVCHALGETFGFDPFLLRVALAVALMFRPGMVLAAYGCAGVLVLASRMLVRRPRNRAVVHADIAPQVVAAEPLRLAA